MKKYLAALVEIGLHQAQTINYMLLGEKGMKALFSKKEITDEEYKRLSPRIKRGAKVMIDRMTIVYSHRNIFSPEENAINKRDTQFLWSLPLIKKVWEEFKPWHTKEFRAWIHKLTEQ